MHELDPPRLPFIHVSSTKSSARIVFSTSLRSLIHRAQKLFLPSLALDMSHPNPPPPALHSLTSLTARDVIACASCIDGSGISLNQLKDSFIRFDVEGVKEPLLTVARRPWSRDLVFTQGTTLEPHTTLLPRAPISIIYDDYDF